METHMQRRWAVLILLLAAAAPPPITSPEPAFEHFKGTWAVTLKTRHDTTCSADGVTFKDARDDNPITAEFALSCAGAEGVAGFVQLTITNPGRHDALAHVNAQAARNHPGKLYNVTGHISWPSPDHLVITAQPSRDGAIRQLDLTRAS
jgi:hypothetical protein